VVLNMAMKQLGLGLKKLTMLENIKVSVLVIAHLKGYRLIPLKV
jgi:hypothetical protein